MTNLQSPADISGFPFDPSQVAPRLLAWYGRHGRDLPWRGTRDPYRIWLAEIMLQQTTVAAAIPYFRNFLAAFPVLAALAAAPQAEVIAQWAGLGYYSRARNLHRTAQLLMERFAGRFPETVEELATLPGIGRSTAGAIVALAFDKPAPILDGNVRRVLVRLFACQDDPRSSAAERRLWAWAEALTCRDHPHDYTQAIMDLGATLCTPLDPACPACPLTELCQARRYGLERRLPVPRARKAVPVRRQAVVLVERNGSCLARPRPAEGFLGGLWELPAVDLRSDEEPCAAAVRLAAELGVSGQPVLSGHLKHAYSHFTLELALVRLNKVDDCRVAEGDWQWLPPARLRHMPLHGAHRKALARFLTRDELGTADG